MHNHTHWSRDGTMSPRRLLELARGRGIDCLAVTDHDRFEGAREAAALAAAHPELPRVIPGQEITTQAGELIGLYLVEAVPAGLPPLETVARIHRQGWLAYLPHPCDSLRRGSMAAEHRDLVARAADLIEVRNGRSLRRGFDRRSTALAHALAKPGGAGSDAHYEAEVGLAWALVTAIPTRDTLPALLWEGSVSPPPSRLQLLRAFGFAFRTGLAKRARRRRA